jgi:uncharacterized membrane protein YphA (DoxX/SURF4 family)
MRSTALRLHHWRAGLSAVTLLLLPHAALAHERFIRHTPTAPLHEGFFRSLNPSMLNIALRVAFILAGMLFLWFIRLPLDDVVENGLLRNLRGKPKEVVHLLASFVLDRPVERPTFQSLGEWMVVFFLRSPALVLMFAASNNSLVMPSYPLEPSTLMLFQFVQVAMAIGILTQTCLPEAGAVIFGTFIYMLWAYDWKIAVDVLPVLTVAVVYVSSPWDSWRRPIISINRQQMHWVRLVLGFSFFALGWMKIYNYYLTVGVADNYPSVMHDRLIQMFYFGTPVSLKRECWIMAFALSEVMTGFLLMAGVFSRIWCLMMVYVFTKLMVVDFGWPEIPHIYPIAAFLVVLFSNNLSHEFSGMDRMAEAAAQKGALGLHVIRSLALAILLAAVAIFPLLYLLTKVPHPAYW